MTGREAAEKICTHLGNVTPDEILGRDRTYRVATARQLVMWYMVRVLGISYNSAGHMLNRTHASVMFGVHQMENTIEVNRNYDRRLIEVAMSLKNEYNEDRGQDSSCAS